MTPIRVLVVDDSVVIRRLVTTVLAEDSDIEVIGTAANGRIAIDKLTSGTLPDVVTLDMEMPVMNGIETLREIRKRWPRLPVIMFSTLTAVGAAATLDALSAGASDFVAKPSNVGSVALGMQAVRDQLIPKVRLLAGRPMTPTTHTLPGTPTADAPRAFARVSPAPVEHTTHVARTTPSSHITVRSTTPVAPVTARPTPARAAIDTVATPRRFTRALSGKVTAVVIGVSTGGPNALAEIWPRLAALQVPVLIVQHMPPVFTTMLAKRLDAIGTVRMSEGVQGGVVGKGDGWLAPGDHHMRVEQTPDGVRLCLDQEAPENSCRPAVDPLFRSAAAVYGPGTLAVVLTGMGSDGLAGARAVREAGGTVLAQDEPSSVVWGMPGAVVNAGLADVILPLDRMAAEISARCGAVLPSLNVPPGRVVAS
ncbi:MAG: chemotaxis response regulator protein-glutamate methylesterase [Acidimicrobiales bacterium]